MLSNRISTICLVGNTTHEHGGVWGLRRSKCRFDSYSSPSANKAVRLVRIPDDPEVAGSSPVLVCCFEN